MLEGISLSTLIMGSLFLFTVIIVASVGNWLFSGNATFDRRLREIQGMAPNEKGKAKEEGPFKVKWLQPVTRLVVPDDKWKQSRIRARLVRAGYRSPQAMGLYYLSKFFLAVLLPVLTMSYAQTGLVEASAAASAPRTAAAPGRAPEARPGPSSSKSGGPSSTRASTPRASRRPATPARPGRSSTSGATPPRSSACGALRSRGCCWGAHGCCSRC